MDLQSVPYDCPIRAQKALFPGTIGDVAMLRNPSEEIYQVKPRDIYLGSTLTGGSNVLSFKKAPLSWLLHGAVTHEDKKVSEAGFKEAVLIYELPVLAS